MHPSVYINLTTARMAAEGPGGSSVGTGYFYFFQEPGVTDRGAMNLITNKHVIHGAERVRIALNIMPVTSEIRADGSADGEQRVNVEIELSEPGITRHPDPNVDLCALSMADLEARVPAGYIIKSRCLHRGMHLSEDEKAWLRPIEPIVMVGYPNGLWDEENNRPITRQGMTASHALLNWNGRRDFVIDAACFGGSSGSPVFLYEDGWYRNGETSYAPGARIRLLGTLWGGPMTTAEGRLIPRAIPTSMEAVPIVHTPLNLGFVVHASAIDDLAPLILQAAAAA